MAAPQAVVKGQTLNVRAGPGADFAIITTAKQGQSFELVGRNPDNAWLRVCCFDNMPGWVSAALVDVTGGELAKLPVPKDMPTAAPSPTTGAAAPTSAAVAAPSGALSGVLYYSKTDQSKDRWELWQYNLATDENKFFRTYALPLNLATDSTD